MTPEAYAALTQSARRRFAQWDLTRRELRILELVLELSFECGQIWACVPRLQLMADACMMDRADVSRTLKHLVQTKGTLKKQEHRGEVLYTIAIQCETVPLRTERPMVATPEKAEAAVEELKRIQRLRLNGTADATGQMRLDVRTDGEKAEDHAGPELALAAMLEEADVTPPKTAAVVNAGRSGTPPALPAFTGTETDEEYALKLEAHAKADVARAAETTRALEPQSLGPEDSRAGIHYEACKRSLSENQQYLFERLEKECARRGARGLQELRQWAPKWKERIQLDPYAVGEAISDHQLRRGGPADSPGAWIRSQFLKHTRKENAT